MVTTPADRGVEGAVIFGRCPAEAVLTVLTAAAGAESAAPDALGRCAVACPNSGALVEAGCRTSRWRARWGGPASPPGVEATSADGGRVRPNAPTSCPGGSAGCRRRGAPASPRAGRSRVPWCAWSRTVGCLPAAELGPGAREGRFFFLLTPTPRCCVRSVDRDSEAAAVALADARPSYAAAGSVASCREPSPERLIRCRV